MVVDEPNIGKDKRTNRVVHRALAQQMHGKTHKGTTRPSP